MNKISVILPVYNGSKYLEQSIISVIEQDCKNYEFLICDDASKDSSLEILEKIRNKYPDQVKLFFNDENLGLFKTLNKLIFNSSSPLIHLWAQDDVMMSNCLSECIKFHEKFPEISMSYHGVEYVDEHSDIIKSDKIDQTPEIIPSWLYARISIKWGCIAGNIANVTLSRASLQKTGLFDESLLLSGDFKLWTKLASDSPIGRISKKLIFLRNHREQLSKDSKKIALRIQEDLPIQKEILEMLNPDDKKSGERFFKWKTQTAYFNDMLFLLSLREYPGFKILAATLKKETNIYVLFLRWLVIRFLRITKLDSWFYHKVLQN